MSRPSACVHNSYLDNCPDCAQDAKVSRLEAEVKKLRSDLATMTQERDDLKARSLGRAMDPDVCANCGAAARVPRSWFWPTEPLKVTTVKPTSAAAIVAAIAAGAVPGTHWPEGRTYERRHGVPKDPDVEPQVLHGTPLNDQDGHFHFRYGTPPSTAVTATHGPTGLVVTCGDNRSLLKNKGAAIKALKQKLLEACSRDFRTIINRFPTLEEIEAAEREPHVILNVFDPESFDRAGLRDNMDALRVARLLATHGLRSSSYHAILLASGDKTPEVAAADWLRDLRAEPILRPLTTRPLMGFEKEP